MPAADPQSIPAWKRLQWPALVVALLGGHVFLVAGALVLAAAMIPAAVTAPAGYEEALGWDAQQEARRASAALGWTLDVTPLDQAELNGDRRVQFILRDRDGLPVKDATIELSMYHHARPADRVESRLEPQEVLGVYDTVLPLRREGFWRMSAVATRDEDRFLVDADLWIGAPAK